MAALMLDWEPSDQLIIIDQSACFGITQLTFAVIKIISQIWRTRSMSTLCLATVRSHDLLCDNHLWPCHKQLISSLQRRSYVPFESHGNTHFKIRSGQLRNYIAAWKHSECLLLCNLTYFPWRYVILPVIVECSKDSLNWSCSLVVSVCALWRQKIS